MQAARLNKSIKLEIVTPEKLIFQDQVSSVIAPGIEGVLGIYPNHCPLLTILQAGELKINRGDEEFYIAIGGGFMEVRKEKIIILADVAERDEEISEQKALEAKKRAEKILSDKNVPDIDKAEIAESLRLEMIRLNIVEKRNKRKKMKIITNTLYDDSYNNIEKD